MSEDLRAEIQRHIDHLNKAEAAQIHLWHAISTATNPAEQARFEALRKIEIDVWQSHFTWLHTRGIDFKHLDRCGMEWKPYEVIDLVALVEQELAAKAADRERMREAQMRAIMAQASQ